MARKQWVTIAQAAEMRKVAEKTIRRGVKAKKYRSKRVKGKFGPIVLVLREDVEKDVQGFSSDGQQAATEEIPTLKEESPGQAQSGQEEVVSEASTPLTVLIADESEDVIRLISGILGEHGINALIARDGREALEIIHAHHPALLIVEPALPVMDGFQVAKEMEADADIGNIPVAFCSFHKDRSVINEGLNFKNAVRYFAKPLLGKQLRALKLFVQHREWVKQKN